VLVRHLDRPAPMALRPVMDAFGGGHGRPP
jgi:hypothetical protein